MGDYRETYERCITDPEAFWGEQAELVDWFRKPSGCSTTVPRRSTAGSPTARLNTCYNALDRHVVSGPRRPARADLRQRGDRRRSARYTYAELLDRGRGVRRGAARARRRARATGSSIYMPMIPEAVIAMLACARIGAVHSVVFGGFAAARARRPHRRRAAEGRRRRRPAGSSRRASSSTSRCSTRRSSSPSTRPTRSWSSSGRRPRRRWSRAATSTGTLAMRAGRTDPAACVEVAATDPLYILYTSGTTGKPKGIVRDNGGHAVALAWSLPNIYDIARRRGLVDRLRRRLGRRPLLHRLRAADRRRDHGALRGQAGRHAGRRRVLAGDRRARRRGAVHRADRDPGDQEGGPRRRRCCADHDISLAARPLPGRRAARPGHLRLGDRAARRPGRRQLVADRDRLADRGQPARPRADADQAGLADGAGARATTCEVLDERGRAGAGRRGGRDLRPAAAAAGHAADAVGRRRAVRRRRTSRPSTATTSPATVATSTRTATST